ncbi:MAG: hypothetical protein JKY19_03290 [Alcanivoracaceae bacterium]|nr:hypothetical protein [Alcanivoracaceae bacterium]
MQLKTKAIMAHVMVILNLLFPFIYFFIFISWLKNKKSNDDMLRVAINEAFILATITFIIFTSLITAVLVHYGFKSTFTLVAGEIYYMLIIPLCFFPAIMGVARNNADRVYYYPMIAKLLK